MPKPLRTETRWGLTWHKGEGSQSECIKHKKDGEIVIAYHNDKLGQGFATCMPNKLEKLIKSNKGLYEVLYKYPKKLYFDIDFKDPPHDFNEDTFLQSLISDIREYYPDCEFAISGSVSDTKVSYHMVSCNYAILNELELIRAKQIAKAIQTKQGSVDTAVYTKHRQMKMINQSKPKKSVQKPMGEHHFTEHFISCYIREGCLSIPSIDIFDDHKQNAIGDANDTNIRTVPTRKLPCPDGIVWDDLLRPDKKIDLLHLIPHGDHRHSWRVCNFCISNAILQTDFFDWLKKKDGDVDARIHKYKTDYWDKIARTLRVDPDKAITQEKMRNNLVYWYENIKPQDQHYNRFCKLWELPEELIHVSPRPTIDDIANNYQKLHLLANPMGAGKTECIMEYIKRHANGECIWVAPRRTLVDDTVSRLKDRGVDCTDYQKIGGRKSKIEVMPDAERTPNIITCLNSLGFVRGRRPRVLVIDEIETILNTLGMSNGTMGINKKRGDGFLPPEVKLEILETLERLVRECPKVILLDAFMTMRTLRYFTTLARVEINPKTCIIYKSPKPTVPPRQVIVMQDKVEHVCIQIAKDIADGKRVICFYPFKNDTNNARSMEWVVEAIKNVSISLGYKGNPAEEFVYYHAGVDEKTKKEIHNVNKYWLNRKLVVFNNCITSGVSYTADAFDECYLFIAPFSSPRDIAQVSYRARTLNSKTIKVKYMSGLPAEVWKNDTGLYPNCAGYSELFADTLIELCCPIKKSMFKFFYEANYEQQDILYDVYIDETMEQVYSDTTCNYYSYNSIEDISERQAQNLIEMKHAGGELGYLSVMDGLQLKKMVFKSLFKPNTPEHTLMSTWERDNLPKLLLVRDAYKNDNSVEMVLARENNWSFFPEFEQSKKPKINLSKEVIDLIFQENCFKRHSRNTNYIFDAFATYYNGKYRASIVNSNRINGNLYYSATPVNDYLVDVAKELK